MSKRNIPMNLAGKASAGVPRRSGAGQAGYAMAALLVGLAVMAIMLSVAMPTWSHMIRRENEEELIFRGTQYARAINQYQRKFANASPASLDVLIQQRMLRKKFRDPLSPSKDGEFQLLYLQNQSPIGGSAQGSRGTGRAAGGGMQGPSSSSRGPIIGVTSKNTGQSIRVFKGKNRYNEWEFIGMELSQGGPAAGDGGRAGPQRGGRQGGGRQGGRDGGGMTPPRGGTTFTDLSGETRTLPSRQGR